MPIWCRGAAGAELLSGGSCTIQSVAVGTSPGWPLRRTTGGSSRYNAAIAANRDSFPGCG
eukprot:761475-Hanusia_phi.AAC.8